MISDPKGIHMVTAGGTQKTQTGEGRAQTTGRGESRGLCAESITAVLDGK